MVDDTSTKASGNNDPKLVTKVKKFQLSSVKSFGTVDEKSPGGGCGFHPHILFRVKTATKFKKGQCFGGRPRPPVDEN